MRLLSQKSLKYEYDIPYEFVCLNISSRIEGKCRIYVWHPLSINNDNVFRMAEYTSREKAVKVLEQMRECYNACKTYFRFPEDEEVQENVYAEW